MHLEPHQTRKGLLLLVIVRAALREHTAMRDHPLAAGAPREAILTHPLAAGVLREDILTTKGHPRADCVLREAILTKKGL